MLSVTVLCPNAHRCSIHVKRSSQLRNVLETVCLKEGYDVDAYTLRHHNSIIDLDLPLNWTNLTNNATLEMILLPQSKSSTCLAQITLQVETLRLTREFDVSITFYDMLLSFSEMFNRDLLSCPDGKFPSCMYVNTECKGIAQLSSTTLKSLGIRPGRSLIRYHQIRMSNEEYEQLEANIRAENACIEKMAGQFKVKKEQNLRLERLHEEWDRNVANSSVQESLIQTKNVIRNKFPREIQEESNILQKSHAESVPSVPLLPVGGRSVSHSSATSSKSVEASKDCNSFDIAPQTKNQFSFETNRIDSEPSAINVLEFDRNLVHFERSELLQLISADQSDTYDQFYELSAQELRRLQKLYKSEAECARALLPRSFIEQTNKKLRMDAYKHTVVRFIFSGNLIVQARFFSLEPVSSLYDLVASILDLNKFILSMVLNMKIANDKKITLLDSGIAPSSNLYVQNIAKDIDVISQVLKNGGERVDGKRAKELSDEWLEENTQYVPYDPKFVSDQVVSGNQQSTSIDTDSKRPRVVKSSTSQIPKWFLLK